MITITIPASEWYDEKRSEIVSFRPCELTLEYSLISISEWEMKTKKVYLSTKEKTLEEWLYLFYCMVINKNNLDERIFYAIPPEEYMRLQAYIADPMSATQIHDTGKKKLNTGSMSSEEIYCAMSMLNIPYECKKWHLNRLLKLIEVCAIKNAPPEKMSKEDAAAEWRKVNAANRAKFKSKG